MIDDRERKKIELERQEKNKRREKSTEFIKKHRERAKRDLKTWTEFYKRQKESKMGKKFQHWKNTLEFLFATGVLLAVMLATVSSFLIENISAIYWAMDISFILFLFVTAFWWITVMGKCNGENKGLKS